MKGSTRGRSRWSEAAITADAGGEAERGARRRLVLSLCVSFVVLVVLSALAKAWVEGDRTEMEARTSLSARADAFRGGLEVLRKLGIHCERQLRSYARLPPAEESVLVILDPLPNVVLEMVKDTRVDTAQVRELTNWISQGGRVVAAPPGRTFAGAFSLELKVDEQPGRRLEGGESMFDCIFESAGPPLAWTPASGEVHGAGALVGFSDLWQPPAPSRARLVGSFLRRPGGKEIFPGLATAGEEAVEIQTFAGDLPEELEAAASLAAHPIVATARKGDGSVWLFSSAYPFTNLGLAEGGTAHLVAAVMDRATGGGERTVYFDEYCHGLWRRRGLLGWIIGTTLSYPVVGALLLAGLLLWRGGIRPGAAAEPRVLPRRAKEEFVVSLADILLRADRHRAAARSLVDTIRHKRSRWTHRFARFDAQLTRAGPFGGADLQQLAGELDEEERRIEWEESRRAKRP